MKYHDYVLPTDLADRLNNNDQIVMSGLKAFSSTADMFTHIAISKCTFTAHEIQEARGRTAIYFRTANLEHLENHAIALLDDLKNFHRGYTRNRRLSVLVYKCRIFGPMKTLRLAVCVQTHKISF